MRSRPQGPANSLLYGILVNTKSCVFAGNFDLNAPPVNIRWPLLPLPVGRVRVGRLRVAMAFDRFDSLRVRIEGCGCPESRPKIPVWIGPIPTDITSSAHRSGSSPTVPPFRPNHASVRLPDAPLRSNHASVRLADAPLRSNHASVRLADAPLRSNHASVCLPDAPLRSKHAPFRLPNASVRRERRRELSSGAVPFLHFRW
jgi:hypothetical protein